MTVQPSFEAGTTLAPMVVARGVEKSFGAVRVLRGIDLDVVIELVVDDKALVGRILRRAEEAKAAGQPVRKDDTAEVFDERLREYYKKTAPLIGYYHAKGKLVGVDGMADIDAVTAQVEKVLAKHAGRGLVGAN